MLNRIYNVNESVASGHLNRNRVMEEQDYDLLISSKQEVRVKLGNRNAKARVVDVDPIFREAVLAVEGIRDRITVPLENIIIDSITRAY